MTAGVLDVLIAGKLAGTLSQDGAGSLSFAYERGYRGVPLSSSMPLSTRPYRDKVVLPYLWGLLPEDPAVRRHVAADADISPNNPFALLGVIGLDCPGAVQFVPQGSDAYRDERLVAVSDAEIARRLATGRQDGAGWIASNEHWSLGGQQSKFALRRMGGRWYSCEGSAATTHILKSGVRGLTHQALNEYVCMRLATSLDVPAASVEYLEFEGESGVEPAIVIERYDRLVEGDNVTRLHQEDLCQALGCLPDNKYTMYGGPNCAEVLGLLTSTEPTAQANAAGFLQMLFLNYLLAATDAHAKNYSIMLAADGSHRLAPMYDVASIAPYVEGARLKVKPPKLAMSIGGENRAGHVSANDLAKLVEQCGLERFGITAEGCRDLLALYAKEIPGKLAQEFDALEKTGSADAARELRGRMEKPIAQLCARSLKGLGS